MAKEGEQFTGNVLGIDFYRRKISDLRKKQENLPTISFEWTCLQEEIELAQLKWHQLNRRIEMNPFWK